MQLLKPTLLASGGTIECHRHRTPYATILLSGSYEEAGDAGRVLASAGEVLLHAPFSCHRNRISGERTWVLDLPLPFDGRRWAPRARVADADRVARLCERDPAAAVEFLLEQLVPTDVGAVSAADLLAAALRRAEPPSIAVWALERDMSREHLSRQFRATYGMPASTYRAESQARRAWHAIVGSDDSLAMVAAGAGFADQAHMTRAVARLTGRTPGQWRKWGRIMTSPPN